jgi:hypothetical protein
MTETSSVVEPSPPPAASTDPLSEFAPTSTGNKIAWVLGAIVLILVIALVIGFFGWVRHWFALHTGIVHGGPDEWYNFWSGFGSDLGEATLISAVSVGVITGLRKVNCHTKGCWRIGHHPLDGTPYILCRHHHPHVPNGGASHDDILLHHHKYKLEKEAERRARASV